MIPDFPSSHRGAVNIVNDPSSRAVLKPCTETLKTLNTPALFSLSYTQVYSKADDLAPTLLPSGILVVAIYSTGKNEVALMDVGVHPLD